MQQECIPVGYVTVRRQGVSQTETPQTETPRQRPPWTETPLDWDALTETPCEQNQGQMWKHFAGCKNSHTEKWVRIFSQATSVVIHDTVQPFPCSPNGTWCSRITFWEHWLNLGCTRRAPRPPLPRPQSSQFHAFGRGKGFDKMYVVVQACTPPN